MSSFLVFLGFFSISSHTRVACVCLPACPSACLPALVNHTTLCPAAAFLLAFTRLIFFKSCMLFMLCVAAVSEHFFFPFAFIAIAALSATEIALHLLDAFCNSKDRRVRVSG